MARLFGTLGRAVEIACRVGDHAAINGVAVGTLAEAGGQEVVSKCRILQPHFHVNWGNLNWGNSTSVLHGVTLSTTPKPCSPPTAVP